ncbi:MAG: RluA family pseudouridine synthase [Caldilineales bacterium]|nr:RluA family pseudouridine synthase [Caldilineales bacterium]MDW8317527.1 RluA family pseudouridine synthase [Anaerolineae bacterium]
MTEAAIYRFTVEGATAPLRLDRALQRHRPTWGRRAVRSLVEGGQVRVNGRRVTLCSWQVRNGDRIELLSLPPDLPQGPTAFDDGWLIAETPELVAVNKPAGLLSEPPPRRKAGNLLDLAAARFGPVHLFHRLDRDTSGVVLLTRHPAVNRYLDAAFKAGTVAKEYLAVVEAAQDLPPEGVIRLPIGPHPTRRDMMAVVPSGGRRAVTRFQVVHGEGERRWVRLWPETGRTHQLRVHLAHLAAPIAGDRLYNPDWRRFPRLMLHALRLTLPADAPFSPRAFTAPLPADFAMPADRAAAAELAKALLL